MIHESISLRIIRRAQYEHELIAIDYLDTTKSAFLCIFLAKEFAIARVPRQVSDRQATRTKEAWLPN